MKEKFKKEGADNAYIVVDVVNRVLEGIAFGPYGRLHPTCQCSDRSDAISGSLQIPSKATVQQCLPISPVGTWGFDHVHMLFHSVVNSAANHILIEFLNFFSELDDRLQKQLIAFNLVNANQDSKHSQDAGNKRTNVDHELFVLEKHNNDRQRHSKYGKNKQRVQKVGNWVINNLFDQIFNQVANLHFYLRGLVKSCLGIFDFSHAFGDPFISTGVL